MCFKYVNGNRKIDHLTMSVVTLMSVQIWGLAYNFLPYYCS
jgi:hypothetical protein